MGLKNLAKEGMLRRPESKIRYDESIFSAFASWGIIPGLILDALASFFLNWF